MLRTLSPFKMPSFDGLWSEFFRDPPTPFQPSNSGYSPALNVWETETDYFAETEIPGLELDDIEVEVEGNQLSLRGERQSLVTDETTRLLRQERKHGRFHRQLRFPTEIDATKVSASLKDGVLTITGGGVGTEVVINSTDDDGMPTQWLINHQGSESVDYASVKNSGCDPGSTTITTTKECG